MNGSNLMVVQGGGPTQVLNATLAAVIEEAHATKGFERVLGARGGTKGLAEGSIVNLTGLSSNELASLRTTPGAVLGSSRLKSSAEDMEQIVRQLERMKVRHVLFAGGNGTMYGAALLLQHCRRAGYDVQMLGLPKTVDNDISRTDRCPGYASGARYIAQSARDLGTDVKSLPQPVSILETMGRSVGWLAAASAMGKRDEADAPHLVCLPEAPFDMERFISVIDDAVVKYGWAVVAVSEGIRYGDGRMVYQKLDPAQADPLNRPLTGGVGHFLADEVAARLGIRCRCEQPGLLGRSSALHTSCQDRKDAELVGRAGVRGLLENRTSQMVSLLPLRYAGEAGYVFVELDEVAGIERHIPAEWIGDGAIPLKTAFFEYLRPLAGELMPYHPPISAELNFNGNV